MARRKTSSAEPEKSERLERLKTAINTLKGKYPGRVLSGEEYTMPWAVRRLPFGIPDLDVATRGGAPAGGLTMLTGKPGEGKNYLLNRIIANQQRLYGNDCAVAIVSLEQSYDKTQALACGVHVTLSDREIQAEDKRRAKLDLPLLSEAEIERAKTPIGTFIVVPQSTAEESFDIVVELVRSGDFNVVGIDSFGAVLAEDEKDKSFENDSRVGGPAGLNTRLMRKLSEAFAPDKDGNPNITCLIGINQVRDNLKAMAFQKSTQESGGWALKHARFLTIELTRIDYLKDEKTKRKYGKTIKWEITKQKAGGHEGATGEYIYLLDECAIDMGELVLRLGQDYGLIKKEGNKFIYCGTVIGVGALKAARMLVELGLTDEITEEILRRAGVALVV